MNAKKCKALRRLAERNTLGKPARRLVAWPRGNAINDPQSTRGEYRALKKIVKTIKFSKVPK
jgi:hypothetical protein